MLPSCCSYETSSSSRSLSKSRLCMKSSCRDSSFPLTLQIFFWENGGWKKDGIRPGPSQRNHPLPGPSARFGAGSRPGRIGAAAASVRPVTASPAMASASLPRGEQATVLQQLLLCCWHWCWCWEPIPYGDVVVTSSSCVRGFFPLLPF